MKAAVEATVVANVAAGGEAAAPLAGQRLCVVDENLLNLPSCQGGNCDVAFVAVRQRGEREGPLT